MTDIKSRYKNVYYVDSPKGIGSWKSRVGKHHLGTFPIGDDGELAAYKAAFQFKRNKHSSRHVTHYIQQIKSGRINTPDIIRLRSYLLTLEIDFNHCDLKRICEVVCEFMDVTFDQVCEHSRMEPLPKCRMIISHIAIKHKHEASTIGRYIHKDHTSILYYKKVVAERMQVETDFFEEIVQIESLL